MVLDDARSIAKKVPMKPKCSRASSGAIEVVGRSSPRPIASAIALFDTLVSPTACRRAPAGAFSKPRRTILAASERCTAAHPVEPSATYPDRPFARAAATIKAMKPWSPSPCTVGANRRLIDLTPFSR